MAKVKLLPQLPGPAAEFVIDRFLGDGPANWAGFDPNNLPDGVRYAPTGGSPANPRDLVALRDTIRKCARDARAVGYKALHGDARIKAGFDAKLGTLLAEMPLLSSGEALRDDFWAFVGTSLAPNVVYWRFGAARQRYLGGVRNTFQRLWLRARALDRGVGHRRRWRLLHELTEDALVQITERPSIGADRVLASAVAEAWLRARNHHGRGAIETIMRRAIRRVRAWNEIRSLADLPTDALARVLDRAFDLPAEGPPEKNPVAAPPPREVDESPTSSGSRDGKEEEAGSTGDGTIRYKGFRANVWKEGAGTLFGKVVNEDGWRIGMVTAGTAVEFERRMKQKVDAYLRRG